MWFLMPFPAIFFNASKHNTFGTLVAESVESLSQSESLCTTVARTTNDDVMMELWFWKKYEWENGNGFKLKVFCSMQWYATFFSQSDLTTNWRRRRLLRRQIKIFFLLYVWECYKLLGIYFLCLQLYFCCLHAEKKCKFQIWARFLSHFLCLSFFCTTGVL